MSSAADPGVLISNCGGTRRNSAHNTKKNLASNQRFCFPRIARLHLRRCSVLILIMAPWITGGVGATSAFCRRSYGTPTKPTRQQRKSAIGFVRQKAQVSLRGYRKNSNSSQATCWMKSHKNLDSKSYRPNCPSLSLFHNLRTTAPYHSTFSTRFMGSIENENNGGHQEEYGGREHKKKRTKRESVSNGKHASASEVECDNTYIEEETRDWVKRVVVGLNLCPFAAKPLADEQLYVTVVRGHNLEEILEQILVQSLVFTEDDLPGTALLVCPDLVPHDFNEYLNVLTMVVDGLLEDHDLVGRVQVVPFHPEFIFAGDDDGDNSKLEYWTNRSPYPMFHILKEDDVSHAIDLVRGDTDKVWQRNIHLLQRMETLAEEDSLDGQTLSGNDNDNKRDALETYLRNGRDSEGGAAMSIVKQALEETSKEFPLLQRPISNEIKGMEGEDGDDNIKP